MAVPPNAGGAISGRMNGVEHRIADGSVVSGTQWTNASPKNVSPNASPLR